MVAEGVGLVAVVSEMALAMAWGPVRDSISTEFMYRTLHAGKDKETCNIDNHAGLLEFNYSCIM